MNQSKNDFQEMLKHSILITWDKNIQRWRAECPVLGIRFDAELYIDVVHMLVYSINNMEHPEGFYEKIEGDKKSLDDLGQ